MVTTPKPQLDRPVLDRKRWSTLLAHKHWYWHTCTYCKLSFESIRFTGHPRKFPRKMLSPTGSKKFPGKGLSPTGSKKFPGKGLSPTGSKQFPRKGLPPIGSSPFDGFSRVPPAAFFVYIHVFAVDDTVHGRQEAVHINLQRTHWIYGQNDVR